MEATPKEMKSSILLEIHRGVMKGYSGNPLKKIISVKKNSNKKTNIIMASTSDI
jgi:hypothetical protein